VPDLVLCDEAGVLSSEAAEAVGSLGRHQQAQAHPTTLRLLGCGGLLLLGEGRQREREKRQKGREQGQGNSECTPIMDQATVL
jgi:hypothetical protein